jgi:hypothetical protein
MLSCFLNPFTDVRWIYLAQCRVEWQAGVNTVMNFRVRKRFGISFLSGQLSGYQQGFFIPEVNNVLRNIVSLNVI